MIFTSEGYSSGVDIGIPKENRTKTLEKEKWQKCKRCNGMGEVEKKKSNNLRKKAKKGRNVENRKRAASMEITEE